MATNTTLRSSTGAAIAILESDNEQNKIRTITGACLGYYDKRSNKTYRINGSFVGYGDLLMTLL